MSYEIEAIEEKDYPVVKTRTSKYTVIINRFLGSQLERGKINCADIPTDAKQIQTALRRIVKKMGKDIEIVVNDKKEVFMKKL